MKSLLVLLVLILFAQPLYAGPFLVCDPYPNTGEQPTEFKITYGTNTITSQAVRNTDGSVQLKWDLGPLANGTYNINVTAVKVDALWGNQESVAVPFSFTKPVLVSPGLPANLKLQR